MVEIMEAPIPNRPLILKRQTGKKLSVVVPIYNEESIVPTLAPRFEALIDRLQTGFGLTADQIEILFVNDGSSDRSLDLLKTLCEKKPYVCLNLSRNYGHQAALTAGLDASSGEAVAMIDGDLQDPPEFIADLYGKHLSGFDVVYAVRRKRSGETWFKKMTATLFYRILKMSTDISLPLDSGDFRIMSRRMVDAICAMREPNRFIRGMTSWVGFKQTGLEYDREERHSGETKFTFFKMLRFAWDAITSFSTVPLKIVSLAGLISAILAMLGAAYVLYLKFFTDRTVLGWTSIVILILFMGGIQLLALGVIGEYLKRISDQTKQRPLYVIEGIYHA